MADQVQQPGLSDTAASGLAYLTFIPAIIFLVVAPYNQNPRVRFHCWQSIFLAIVWAAICIALMIVGVIPFLNLVDLILWPVLGIGFFVLWLIAIIQAFQGKRFAIPVLGGLAEKQANAPTTTINPA
jgi:uncharacterized membrane protein